MTIEGLDLAALDRHLHANGVARSGDLRAELIAGGRSNLTVLVSDDASKWVLRRPPLHGLTPSAHDVAREFRVVAALADTPVPVARVVTMCGDDSVLGAPFAMVEYVSGRVVRTRGELAALHGQAEIDGCVGTLIKVLADLHAVDPAAVGLGDFGRPEGYLERQVRRWGGQWDYVRLDGDPRDGDVHRLHSALAQAVPPASRASIVHGDYRIDNTIVDADDAAIVGGLARLDGQSIVVIGHRKGRDTKERVRRNYGMPKPEGYRKALRLMKMAERFRIPIITLIDTPGAYRGVSLFVTAATLSRG